MSKSALVVSTLMLTAFVISAAQAQVTVEDEEFASYKVMDPEKIAIWLSGYYHGKQGNT